MCAAIVLICGLSTPLLLRMAPFLHSIDIPLRLTGLVERASGRLGTVKGMLAFWDGRGLVPVRVTFEALGLYEVWFMVIGISAGILIACPVKPGISLGDGRSPSAALAVLSRALLITAIYCPVRFAMLVAAAIEFDALAVLWAPAPVIISYIPLAALLAGFAGAGPHWVYASASRLRGGRGMFTKVLALLSVLLLVSLSTTPYCAGTSRLSLPRSTRARPAWDARSEGRQPVRVLIDESHSDWEWTTEPFDTSSFGIRAEYNYYCLRKFISHFYDVSLIQDAITPRVLNSQENLNAPRTSDGQHSLNTNTVLIIKTPTRAYDTAEIDAILRFVENGGGLLLIGDHDNLFGMTTHLNAIAERFGMRFRNDDTFDLVTGGFSSLVSLGPWSHPAVRGIRRFEFLTSCTVEAGTGIEGRVGIGGIEPVILGCAIASEDGDYGHPNFFGNIAYDLSDRFGVFMQAAATRFGRGRVLLFTDSTCFSNFCMFAPGAAELILGFLGHLSDGIPDACACHLAGRVLVDTVHSHASFYDYLGYRGFPAWQRFEEFYLSIVRMGLFPAGGEIDDLAQMPARSLVIVNPRGQFSAGELATLSDFVEGGGSLLVLDTIANPGRTASEILRMFGMNLAIVPSSGQGEADFVPVLEVRGGEPIVNDPSYGHPSPTGSSAIDSSVTGSSGRVTAARACYGNGVVIAAVDSYMYSEIGLGKPLQHTHTYDRHLPRFRSLFRLLGELR